MRKVDAQRWIALYDIHCGQERKVVGETTRLCPTHNKTAIRAAFEFMDYYEPSIVVLGGDAIDGGEISSHNQKKPRLTEGIRFKDGLDMLEEEILKPIEKRLPRKCRKVFLTGNHERFIQDFVNANPSLEGFVSIEGYLHLKDREWEIYGLGEVASIGHCHFTHGELLMSKYPAHQALETYRRNIRAGHRHTSASAIDKQSYDKPHDRHTAKIIPCLRDLNPGWMENAPTNWINGLNFGSVNPDKSFTDFVVEMVKNKFVVNGIEFDGRTLARDLR